MTDIDWKLAFKLLAGIVDAYTHNGKLYWDNGEYNIQLLDNHYQLISKAIGEDDGMTLGEWNAWVNAEGGLLEVFEHGFAWDAVPSELYDILQQVYNIYESWLMVEERYWQLVGEL